MEGSVPCIEFRAAGGERWACPERDGGIKAVARERKNKKKKEIKAALLASVHHLGYVARSLGYIFL